MSQHGSSNSLLIIFPRNWNPLTWYSINSSAFGCFSGFSLINSASRFSRCDLLCFQNYLRMTVAFAYGVLDLNAFLCISQIISVPGGILIVHIPHVIQFKNLAKNRLTLASPCVKLWASFTGTKWKKIVIWIP